MANIGSDRPPKPATPPKYLKNSPDWKANGVEPATALKTQGFVAGYKPPAAYFNWFWTKVSECITELQTKAVTNYKDLWNYTNDVFNETVGRNEYGTSTGGVETTVKLGEKFNEGNEAKGTNSHAEGYQTHAMGDYSHSEGIGTHANGHSSHAEGVYTTASGEGSHASGGFTTAGNYQTVVGKYNTAYNGATNVNSDTSGTAFIVGVGTSEATRNAFRVTNSGSCMGVSYFEASGADYAEYFEWKDGNSKNADRRGLFVTLDGEKIRLANAKDTYILGAVSATPNILGDSQSEEWHGRFKRDIFGEIVTETKEGNTQPVLNPDYDASEEYLPRSDRKEWATIGLLGKLIVVDDGSCKVNGYCKVANGGVATSADTGYRVMARIDDTHIRILFR